MCNHYHNPKKIRDSGASWAEELGMEWSIQKLYSHFNGTFQASAGKDVAELCCWWPVQMHCKCWCFKNFKGPPVAWPILQPQASQLSRSWWKINNWRKPIRHILACHGKLGNCWKMRPELRRFLQGIRSIFWKSLRSSCSSKCTDPMGGGFSFKCSSRFLACQVPRRKRVWIFKMFIEIQGW